MSGCARATPPRCRSSSAGSCASPSDLDVVVEGLELARELAGQPPLTRLLGPEVAPGSEELPSYVRRTLRNYFHPRTCGIGRVVDDHGRVPGSTGSWSRTPR